MHTMTRYPRPRTIRVTLASMYSTKAWFKEIILLSLPQAWSGNPHESYWFCSFSNRFPSLGYILLYLYYICLISIYIYTMYMYIYSILYPSILYVQSLCSGQPLSTSLSSPPKIIASCLFWTTRAPCPQNVGISMVEAGSHWTTDLAPWHLCFTRFKPETFWHWFCIYSISIGMPATCHYTTSSQANLSTADFGPAYSRLIDPHHCTIPVTVHLLRPKTPTIPWSACTGHWIVFVLRPT